MREGGSSKGDARSRSPRRQDEGGRAKKKDGFSLDEPFTIMSESFTILSGSFTMLSEQFTILSEPFTITV